MKRRRSSSSPTADETIVRSSSHGIHGSSLYADPEDAPPSRRLKPRHSCNEGGSSTASFDATDTIGTPEDHNDTACWKNAQYSDLDAPICGIKFQDKTYRGLVIFEGEPYGRRTKVYYARSDEGDEIVIKDIYRRLDRRLKEEDLLQHIHSDGDVPGVVRLKGWEYMRAFDGKLLQTGTGDDARVKLRLGFYDYGDNLLKARSVNDLLKAIYDALEVHRTIYVQRRVLHRDMSANNILMYPRRANIRDRKVLESAPPLIEDILSGRGCLPEQRAASCLLVDLGHAALLDDKGAATELASRTGTPMYIARSVCVGSYSYSRVFPAARMPELRGEAYDMYTKAHGPGRYDRYAEKDASTRHGHILPSPPRTLAARLQYTHRPEHDVESVFWTMLRTLLLVRPTTFRGEETGPSEYGARLWKILYEHKIVPDPDALSDMRDKIFQLTPEMWPRYFPPEMADVATLVSYIAEQVAPEYAFWPTQPPEDHLHEAVQRLILQYLVDHRDKDILLDPAHLRPMKNIDDC